MNKKIIAGLVGGFLGMAVGFVGGGVLGINIFGNFFVHITFLGQRGYEAGFYLIGILGGMLGLVSGVFLAVKIAGQASRKT